MEAHADYNPMEIDGDLMILLFAAVASAPWLPLSRRFPLRTLLLAMTLVAAIQGLVMAL
jgi:hypothetical protein